MLLYISFLIEGILISFMIWRFYHKEYWIPPLVIWSIVPYCFWHNHIHAHDYVVQITNQEHTTYKVFYGKDEYIVRQPMIPDVTGQKLVNVNWSENLCSNMDIDNDTGWVFKLDGSYVSNSFLWRNVNGGGVCNLVTLYIDKIEAQNRRNEWNIK